MNTPKRLFTGGLAACALLLCGMAFADSHQGPSDNDKGKQMQPGNPPQATPVRVRIALSGAVINGRTAEGKAEYRAEQGRQELDVEAENVSLPDGTVLTLTVNGLPVGTITLAARRGELEINAAGSAPALIHPGDLVGLTASNGGLTISVLTGQF